MTEFTHNQKAHLLSNIRKPIFFKKIRIKTYISNMILTVKTCLGIKRQGGNTTECKGE